MERVINNELVPNFERAATLAAWQLIDAQKENNQV